MDQLGSMAVFVKTAELGSFSAAARALGMTSQMAGKHVDALEMRLETRLLRRSTRRQSLTEAGAQYLEGCRRALAAAAEAEALVRAHGGQPRGQLRVTAPVAFGSCRLAPLLGEFLAAYPQVAVDLHLGDRQVDLIEAGFDLAFRIGHLPDSGLVARPLGDYRLVLCASPGYLARRGTPRHPRDLASHDCLEYASAHGAASGLWSFTRDGETTTTAGAPYRLRSNDSRTLIAAAVAGAGLLLAGAANVRAELADGRLLALLEGFEAPVRPLSLVHAQGGVLPPKQRVFVDWAVERFADTL